MSDQKVFSLRMIGVCLLVFSCAAYAENPYPFKAKLEKRAGNIAVVAYNDGPATVSAIIHVSSGNCSVDKAADIHIVVKEHTSLLIPQVVRALSSRVACQASLNFKYQMGDLEKALDNQPFRIPFEDGKSHRVGQAFGAPLTSHNSPDSQYALDIDMPEGTKIVAAKDGTVVDFSFSYTNSGSADAEAKLKANFVLLEHADGSITIYSHLAPRPVSLTLGGFVHAGDLIGYSGITGQTSGPHLHFAVLKPKINENGALVSSALPFKFYALSIENIFVPRKGMQLESKALLDEVER